MRADSIFALTMRSAAVLALTASGNCEPMSIALNGTPVALSGQDSGDCLKPSALSLQEGRVYARRSG